MSEHEQWIRIDAAAVGLGVSVRQAYLIGTVDGWRKTGGRPALFALTDVRATYDRRKRDREAQEQSEGDDPTRARASDRRLLVSA